VRRGWGDDVIEDFFRVRVRDDVALRKWGGFRELGSRVGRLCIRREDEFVHVVVPSFPWEDGTSSCHPSASWPTLGRALELRNAFKVTENEEDTLALSRRNIPDQLASYFAFPG